MQSSIDRVESFAFLVLIRLLGSCTDTADGATDTYHDGCEWYDATPQDCGLYDDDDFVSNEVCCACGGIFLVTSFYSY